MQGSAQALSSRLQSCRKEDKGLAHELIPFAERITDRPATAPYAALIFAMKRSSSSRRRALSLDRVRAELSTSSEAAPVSVAPRLTCMTLVAASCVPCATFWTLRAISCVAELCCSTAL